MENSSKNEWFVGIPIESLMLNSRFTRRFKLLDTLISSRDQSEWTMPICGWFICWNDWSLYEYSRHPPYSNRLSQSVPTIYFLGWISMNMNECEWILITMDWSGLLYTYIMFICLFMYVSCIWISIDPWLNMNEHGFSHDFLQHVWVSPGPPGPDSPRRNSGHAGPVRGQTGASVQAIGAWDARTGRRVPPRRSGGVS